MSSPDRRGLIDRLGLEGFLSFGPDETTVELGPLNVLIGANGSGKSNFVEAFALLHAVPTDLAKPIREGGGAEEWLWRRSPRERSAVARLRVEFASEVFPDPAHPLSYRLGFGTDGGRFAVLEERVSTGTAGTVHRILADRSGDGLILPRNELAHSPPTLLVGPQQTLVSQIRDPIVRPEVARLSDLFAAIGIYRAWSFGPDAPVRQSSRIDTRTDLLLPDLSNLAARLSVLKRDPTTKRRLLELLPVVAEGFSDVDVVAEGGRLSVFLTQGDTSFSTTRLSDGTLRWLCLLTILLDPGSASIVVLEEPEMGLHPDTFPTLRDLLLEASERVQIVMTTHSVQLVDGFTAHPDAVLTFDREETSTRVRRLGPADVEPGEASGSLGRRWTAGHLGGNRW